MVGKLKIRGNWFFWLRFLKKLIFVVNWQHLIIWKLNELLKNVVLSTDLML